MAGPAYHSRRAIWQNKLTEEVMRGVCKKIKTGELAAGDSLPERDALMAEFVTSDGIIDRAFERLMEEGVIKESDGGFVIAAAQPLDAPFALPDRDAATLSDVIAVLEMRIGLECEAASLAATRRTDDQLAEIQAAAKALANATGSNAAHSDFRFHLAIGTASGNPYIRELISYLGPLFIPRMRVPLDKTEPDAADRNLADAISEHADILEAITKQNADAARLAMRAHLSRTLNLLRSI